MAGSCGGVTGKTLEEDEIETETPGAFSWQASRMFTGKGAVLQEEVSEPPLVCQPEEVMIFQGISTSKL